MPREEPSARLFEEIDESLRKAYEELLNEDLPDRFVKLIHRLKGAEAEGANPGDKS